MDPTQTSLLLGSLHFAANKHRDQRRKDETASPYINHPIQVAEILTRVGGVSDIATIQAALLHDTVEDTETTPEELEAWFGVEVRGLVEEMTDDKSLEKSERKRRQIEHAPHLTPKARLVKLADKICNVSDVALSPPDGWSLERRREYLAWSERVVNGLRGCSAELERHFDEVLQMARELLGEDVEDSRRGE